MVAALALEATLVGTAALLLVAVTGPAAGPAGLQQPGDSADAERAVLPKPGIAA